jgi:CBS domain-containing protein
LIPGITGGLLAIGATGLVYLAEDGFKKLPFHWMWWPAIGGLVIGLGGLIEPRALGVGYDVIDQLLTGRATLGLIVGILTVKTLIWSLSLGSGTSGGVLAPVFMIGGALGAWEGMLFPHAIPGFWGILGLAAVVGGVMRSPLTGVIFTLELTHAWGTLLPLVISATAAYAFSALVLKRSVLTEKIARRGLHLTREYSTDPLETFFAREVMRSLDAAGALKEHDEITPAALKAVEGRGGDLIPVVSSFDGTLVGITTRHRLTALDATDSAPRTVREATQPCRLAVHQDQTLRQIAYLFAETGLTSAPVIDPATQRPTGVISLTDLLHARLHDLTEEHHRERVLPRQAGDDRIPATVPAPRAAAR